MQKSATAGDTFKTYHVNDCLLHARILAVRSGSFLVLLSSSGPPDCRLLPSCQDVDEGVLKECPKHQDHAECVPDVDGLWVGDLNRRAARGTQLGCHGQDRGDAEADPGRDGIPVDPEGHPRDADDQDRGNVALQYVVSQAALEVELRNQARKLAFRIGENRA